MNIMHVSSPFWMAVLDSKAEHMKAEDGVIKEVLGTKHDICFG